MQRALLLDDEEISLGKTKTLFLRAVRGSAETASHKTGLGASGRGNFSGREGGVFRAAQ